MENEIEVIEGESNNFKIASYPDKIFTEGVGPCIAVGVLDKYNKIAYLGHYISSDDASENLVDLAVKGSRKIKDLVAVVAGNIPLLDKSGEDEFGEDRSEEDDIDLEDSLKYSKHREEWTLNMIKSKGINKIINYLNNYPSERESYCVSIDTKTKKIEVEKQDNYTSDKL